MTIGTYNEREREEERELSVLNCEEVKASV
jgi:hypothetical protein